MKNSSFSPGILRVLPSCHLWCRASFCRCWWIYNSLCLFGKSGEKKTKWVAAQNSAARYSLVLDLGGQIPRSRLALVCVSRWWNRNHTRVQFLVSAFSQTPFESLYCNVPTKLCKKWIFFDETWFCSLWNGAKLRTVKSEVTDNSAKQGSLVVHNNKNNFIEAKNKHLKNNEYKQLLTRISFQYPERKGQYSQTSLPTILLFHDNSGLLCTDLFKRNRIFIFPCSSEMIKIKMTEISLVGVSYFSNSRTSSSVIASSPPCILSSWTKVSRRTRPVL